MCRAMLRRMDPAQDYARAVRRARRDGFALIALALFASAGLMLYIFGDFGGDDLDTRIQAALVSTFAIGVAVFLGLLGVVYAIRAVLLSRGQRN
jgi:4-amino-4-deoxy-L-arabinose transferase-like glycosyltransferase